MIGKIYRPVSIVKLKFSESCLTSVFRFMIEWLLFDMKYEKYVSGKNRDV